uniref:Beta-defensin-like domain-containing protein n=1 Tax=Apteryx owenii TaxID=8824 RepID=A0A8B9PCD6_APTOW
MKTLFLLFALLLVSSSSPVSQATLFFSLTVSDTVMCQKIGGKCSFLICPFFKRPNGTCYSGLAKCCRPFW